MTRAEDYIKNEGLLVTATKRDYVVLVVSVICFAAVLIEWYVFESLGYLRYAFLVMTFVFAYVFYETLFKSKDGVANE